LIAKISQQTRLAAPGNQQGSRTFSDIHVSRPETTKVTAVIRLGYQQRIKTPVPEEFLYPGWTIH
jgi:hypothetical protein